MVDTWNAAVLNEAVANRSIGGGGEGSTTLSGLTDVNLTTPTDGDLLSYDSVSNKWINICAPKGVNYSETEAVVGIWINGETLYQKTISTGAFPNKSTKQVPHNISNLDKVVNITGIGMGSDFIMLPYFVTNSGTQIYVRSDNIIITTTIDLSGVTNSYITLQYTKQTTP